MKYAVESKIYDSGRTTIKKIKVDDTAESYNKELGTYDYYLDVFETEKEADNFINENME